MYKKLMCIILTVVIAMSLVVLSGCSTKTQESKTAGKNDVASEEKAVEEDTSTSKSESEEGETKEEEKTEGYTLPLVKSGTITLSYMGLESWTPQYSLADNREVWQEIEKKTGVKIKWEVVPSSDYDATLKVRIAGRKLPDMMMVQNMNLIQLQRDGVSIDHTDLIKKYAPNILKEVNSDPLIRAALVGPDGKFYAAICGIAPGKTANVKRLYYRQDWRKRLGLKEPETIEDYYELIKAFGTQDPNGNGKQDEVPIAVKGLANLGTLGTAYDLYLSYQGGWHADKNGKVIYDYIRPEFKEFLAFLTRLYKEGLLPKELWYTAAEQKKLVSQNVVGMYCNGLGQCDAYDKLLKQAGVDLSEGGYYFAPPPVNKVTGERFFDRQPYVRDQRIVITSVCEHPDIAIKWLDYVWGSEEGRRYLSYGIEGKTYVINEEGKPELTDYILNNPEGLGVHAALRTVGAIPPTLMYQDEEGFIAEFVNNEKIHGIPEAAKKYMTKEPFPVVVISTPEDEERMASIRADLDTYRDEMVTKFIMGEEPLDKFDEYVETMKSMGVEELIAIKQRQYDRFLELKRGNKE